MYYNQWPSTKACPRLQVASLQPLITGVTSRNLGEASLRISAHCWPSIWQGLQHPNHGLFTAPDGTIIGEFGFATANGLYLTTKYATDKNGNFVIRERTKETLGECIAGRLRKSVISQKKTRPRPSSLGYRNLLCIVCIHTSTISLPNWPTYGKWSSFWSNNMET